MGGLVRERQTKITPRFHEHLFYTRGFTTSMINSSSDNLMRESNIYLKQYFNNTDTNVLKTEKINKVYFCDDNKTIKTDDYYVQIEDSKFIFI